MSEPIILGYAYLYPSYDGGTVLRFDTSGREINGARPSENIPLCDARQLAAKDAEIARLKGHEEITKNGIERIEELLAIPQDERGFDFGTINRAIEGRNERIRYLEVKLAASEKRIKTSDAREEIIRLLRDEFDPTPPNWEGRDWNDNAEDVADKILAAASAQATLAEQERCLSVLREALYPRNEPDDWTDYAKQRADAHDCAIAAIRGGGGQ